jgi:hypothetical protein
VSALGRALESRPASVTALVLGSLWGSVALLDSAKALDYLELWLSISAMVTVCERIQYPVALERHEPQRYRRSRTIRRSS